MEKKLILETENLSKHYRSCKAVDGVNIHVREGEIYGFIGKNGAGKTTCMKIFSGLSHPTSGSVSLLGYTGEGLCKNNVYSRIGSLIETPGLYLNLSGFANLKLLSLGIGNITDKDIWEILELVDLSKNAKRKVKGYSLGMKQRLGIALALLGKPEILILDEPINGLDPQGIAEMRTLFGKLNEQYGMTIMISSHILEELSKVATTFGIIHKGKLLTEFTKEEFEKSNQEKLELRVDDVGNAVRVLQNLLQVSCEAETENTVCISDYNGETGELVEALVQEGVRVSGVREKKMSLEEYYLNLTSD